MKPHVRRVLRPFQNILFELDPPKPGAYMSGFSKNIWDELIASIIGPSWEGPTSQFSRAAADFRCGSGNSPIYVISGFTEHQRHPPTVQMKKLSVCKAVQLEHLPCIVSVTNDVQSLAIYWSILWYDRIYHLSRSSVNLGEIISMLQRTQWTSLV